MREKVLTSDRIDALANKFDGYIDFKEKVKGIAGITLELADEMVFRIALNLLNKHVLVLIPEEQDGNVNYFVDDILEDKFTDAADKLGDITSALINTPLGDEMENEILDSLLIFLAGFIEKEDPNAPTYKVKANIAKRKVDMAHKILTK